MANKPTSMASMVAKQAAASAKADDQEDEKISRKRTPEGKTWVRLIRPHYDAEGYYHSVGPALLNSDAIPSSAKVLSRQASPADDEEADDE